MRAQVLLEELIDFLDEKIIQLDRCNFLYENLDETLSPSMISQVFSQVERHKETAQNLDIRFVAKLDRFKQLNEVSKLDDLVIDSNDARALLGKLKENVALIQEKECLLKSYEDHLETSHTVIDKGKIKAISAYKNINK